VARGWESKAIEAQQTDADWRPRAGVPRVEDLVPSAERATLELARTRALSDLQLACAPAHRAMLEQAIAELDRRLAALRVGHSTAPERDRL
jgi:phage shock protein A